MVAVIVSRRPAKTGLSLIDMSLRMSGYIQQEKNTSQVGLGQAQQSSQQQLIDWALPHFSDNDSFVTLTFKPGIPFDEAQRSIDVKQFLKRLNRKVFGKQYDKHHKKLKCFPVFEFNNSDGLHVHMLLERPDDTSRLYLPFEATVIETWCSMENTGIPKAQDVQNLYAVKRALGYCTKQIRTPDKLLRVDVNNAHW